MLHLMHHTTSGAVLLRIVGAVRRARYLHLRQLPGWDGVSWWRHRVRLGLGYQRVWHHGCMHLLDHAADLVLWLLRRRRLRYDHTAGHFGQSVGLLRRRKLDMRWLSVCQLVRKRRR